MNYRRMEATALLVFAVCAAVLGFATAWFDLTETQAFVVCGVYLIGGLPAILYLHFIAKAQRDSSRTRNRPRSANSDTRCGFHPWPSGSFSPCARTTQ